MAAAEKQRLRGGTLQRPAHLDRSALPADGDLALASDRVLRAEEFQFLYYFGSLALFVLVIQIVTASSSP